MKYEFKVFELELKSAKDDGNEGIIEGYASTFGNMDLGFDIMDKGAFKKTLKENKGKWPILADHNPSDHIGWNQKGVEDDTGLFTVSALTLGVQKAKEKYLLAKDAQKMGARMGMSIGYSTIKAEPDAENPRVRRLKEVKLWEHSIVTFPMNTQALVTAAKSLGAIDKVTELISHLKAQGISLKDLEIALRVEAAKVDEDPTMISQSLDNLMKIMDCTKA